MDKDIIRKKLQSTTTKIHLSVDIWTSPNSYLHLAVCAHFLNSDEQSYNLLIALPEVTGHSGEHQWGALLPVLKDYGIVRKISALTGDNSGTNDTLCRTISAYLSEYENIDWSASFWRIHCAGHFINLFVQAFMIADQQELTWIESYEEVIENDLDSISEQERKEYEVRFRAFGVLGKLHNVIVHIRSSPQRMKQFELRAGRRVPLDNHTRWNSWWAMLEVALKVQESISWYISTHLDTIDKGDQLSVQDWAQLRTIHGFLEIFKLATLKLEGGYVTLDRVLYIMDLLKLHYSKSLV